MDKKIIDASVSGIQYVENRKGPIGKLPKYTCIWEATMANDVVVNRDDGINSNWGRLEDVRLGRKQDEIREFMRGRIMSLPEAVGVRL